MTHCCLKATTTTFENDMPNVSSPASDTESNATQS